MYWLLRSMSCATDQRDDREAHIIVERSYSAPQKFRKKRLHNEHTWRTGTKNWQSFSPTQTRQLLHKIQQAEEGVSQLRWWYTSASLLKLFHSPLGVRVCPPRWYFAGTQSHGSRWKCWRSVILSQMPCTSYSARGTYFTWIFASSCSASAVWRHCTVSHVYRSWTVYQGYVSG